MDFCFLLKIWAKKICKNISQHLGGKYSQNRIDHAKQSATDALKTAWKKATQKSAETTGDLIGNKITNKILKVSRTSSQSSSKTVANEADNIEHDNGMPKEIYISPEERQKIIDDLILIKTVIMEYYKKNECVRYYTKSSINI